ncbi:dihydrodipicolinate reductase [Salinarchaeum sp. Harcht-Bsk1]|uniref:4-hydroxy-tetrahydrodipicolinate reductase n=1 Tax=Salinarchaeum sp. Harcht-Bsk1 TaxID=1333523 RepID=UPI0003423FC4|nr:4-hydroxy-tetrahydrodipicolinate reductase [Salinarchaeum sp. Harcht-Bsk1]AGN01754.1 dihydrodipicolinate reductase [Salinarchaeum sp. Harcht-Bsk1]
MTEPTRVAIPGATGRMGEELLAEAAGRDDVEVVLATTRSPEAGPIAGVELAGADGLPALLTERDVDVLVDFTVPEPCIEAVEAAADADVDVVVGTTGFDSTETAALREASERTALLKAANFARGVQALLQVVGEAASAMEGYDAELIETHHNGKRDAPSGTAKAILHELEGAREAGDRDGGDRDGATDGDRVHGREGHAPRRDGEVGVHAVRAGDITGIHEVLLAGNHEELRLTHRAEDRGVFAAGALDAAVWLDGQPPGWYDFGDVLGGD